MTLEDAWGRGNQMMHHETHNETFPFSLSMCCCFIGQRRDCSHNQLGLRWCLCFSVTCLEHRIDGVYSIWEIHTILEKYNKALLASDKYRCIINELASKHVFCWTHLHKIMKCMALKTCVCYFLFHKSITCGLLFPYRFHYFLLFRSP